MSNFLNTSVGKKIIMSLSGLFLILFLLLHLTLNLLAVFDTTGQTYIAASQFMEHNAIIYIMQYVLAAGFIIHIVYGTWLTYENRKTRPISYAVPNKTDVTWSSQNMWVTGALVFGFLVLHLFNFLYKIKLTDLIESGQLTEYDLLKLTFSINNWLYSILYIAWFIILGLHLNHAFQSAFQTIGLNNKKWLKRLQWIGSIYAVIITVGFSSITIYFFIQSLNN